MWESELEKIVFSVPQDVCQLRLDFEVFTLQGVGGTLLVDEGVCMDTFTVAVGVELEK